MANSETIKTTIDANINTNGNQAITGAVMNSVLKQMVDSTDAQLAELSADASLPFVKKIEGKYLALTGAITPTAGNAAIYVFKKPADVNVKVVIPKTGNSMHALYAFGYTLTEGDGVILFDAMGVGNEESQSFNLDWSNVKYKYLYVSARPSAGDVSMFAKSFPAFPELEIPNDFVSAEMLKSFDATPRVTTSDNYALNEFVKEMYILPEYQTNYNYRLRPYNKGFILGAFNKSTNARDWACRLYDVETLYKDNDIIPLIADVTTSEMSEGTVFGYIILKNLTELSLLENDATIGEKLNEAMWKQTIFNPLINIYMSGENKNSQGLLSNGVEILVPDTIYAIEGDILQIYWRSVVSAFNPYVFDIHAECGVGNSYPRYYTLRPTSDMVGKSYDMTIKVVNNDGSVVTSKKITLQVTAKMVSPSSMKNILCIGASATETGHWVGELKRRLTENSGDGTGFSPKGLGLSNISFVGRKRGTAVNVPLEATGGWGVRTYASKGQRAFRFQVSNVNTLGIGAIYTIGQNIFIIQEVNVTNGVGNIRCTLGSTISSIASSGILTKYTGDGDSTIEYTSYSEENYSPFWNDETSSIDFMTYANEFCNGKIDLMVWHCGINDLVGYEAEVIIKSFKDILRKYHEQFPNGKVIISSVPVGSVNGGFAANYGCNAVLNYWTFTRRVQQYAKALAELCAETEFRSYSHYCPAMETFDAEHNYPVEDARVNPRSSVTEKRGTNGVHPIVEGSYQIADAIYRTINEIDL